MRLSNAREGSAYFRLLCSKRKKVQAKDTTVVKKKKIKVFPCLEVVRQLIGWDHREMGLEIRRVLSGGQLDMYGMEIC